MKITQDKKNDVAVCRVEGEININTSPELRKAFDGFISANAVKILMDFNNVSYIDSSGLATIIELLQRLRRIGGKFRICSMNQKVKNVFEVTKLHKLFEIFDNEDAALRNF